MSIVWFGRESPSIAEAQLPKVACPNIIPNGIPRNRLMDGFEVEKCSWSDIGLTDISGCVGVSKEGEIARKEIRKRQYPVTTIFADACNIVKRDKKGRVEDARSILQINDSIPPEKRHGLPPAFRNPSKIHRGLFKFLAKKYAYAWHPFVVDTDAAGNASINIKETKPFMVKVNEEFGGRLLEVQRQLGIKESITVAYSWGVIPGFHVAHMQQAHGIKRLGAFFAGAPILGELCQGTMHQTAMPSRVFIGDIDPIPSLFQYDIPKVRRVLNGCGLADTEILTAPVGHEFPHREALAYIEKTLTNLRPDLKFG